MNIQKEMIATYMAAASAIIGDRTPEEIAYDDAIVEGLNQGLPIGQALARAAAKYPDEALQVQEADLPEITARYEYLKEHARILKLIKKHERR